jgi:hypothetical protein
MFIQSDSKKIGVLVKSENMSPAFKIILQPVTEDDESSGMYDIGLETNTILECCQT